MVAYDLLSSQLLESVLCLRQPGCHPHGLKQGRSRGEHIMCLRSLSRVTIQCAQPQGTVRQKWAHAKVAGQGYGLLTVALRLRHVRGRSVRRHGSQEMEGRPFNATLTALTCQSDGLLRQG
jgi:hypothetical protein